MFVECPARPPSDNELPYLTLHLMEMIQEALSEIANISPKVHFKFPWLANATLDELG